MMLVRRVARLVLVLVVIAGVALGGGGYYFATQINADGLRIDPFVGERELSVVQVSGSSITLRERGSRVDELHTAGTYGVQWTSGFGQVTGTPEGGRDVTRGFRLLTGQAPQAGEAVGITQDAFPADPSVALGRAAQEVQVTSPGGRFPAWWAQGTGSTWVVLVHGKGASRIEMLRMMRVPVRLGLNALDITYRNDVLVPRDEQGQYRYGRTEWEDLEAAVGFAQERGATRVVLAGASMGGAVIASFLERSDRTDVVRGLVLDSPLLSFESAVDLGASRRGLPGVGWDLPEPLTWTAKRFTSMRYGVNWAAVDYLDDTSWLDMPTLLFHGTSDDRVPFADSARLAAEKDGFVTLNKDNGVEHVESWNHDPAGYEAMLAAFLTSVSRPAR